MECTHIWRPTCVAGTEWRGGSSSWRALRIRNNTRGRYRTIGIRVTLLRVGDIISTDTIHVCCPMVPPIELPHDHACSHSHVGSSSSVCCDQAKIELQGVG